MKKIDFRLKKQYISDWYIWTDSEKVSFGKNGTEKHFSILRKEKSLSEIRNKINREIAKDNSNNFDFLMVELKKEINAKTKREKTPYWGYQNYYPDINDIDYDLIESIKNTDKYKKLIEKIDNGLEPGIDCILYSYIEIDMRNVCLCIVEENSKFQKKGLSLDDETNALQAFSPKYYVREVTDNIKILDINDEKKPQEKIKEEITIFANEKNYDFKTFKIIIIDENEIEKYYELSSFIDDEKINIEKIVKLIQQDDIEIIFTGQTLPIFEID